MLLAVVIPNVRLTAAPARKDVPTTSSRPFAFSSTLPPIGAS
jgi:hypothetical protein